MRNKIHLLIICLLIGSNIIAQTIIKKIKPSDTDTLIKTFNLDSNYVYTNASVSSKNILLVHLPGSFGEPKRAQLFGTLAAELGFHSIGLMYPNIPTVGSFCTNSFEVDCFENVRREIVEGIDYSTDVSIPAQESILSRTKNLLIYLNNNYPTENWGQFLDGNNNLNFSKIIFSGHSQGGGHAAIIAKYYPLKRVICFSSPKDWRNIPDSPPMWLSKGNWKTPSSEIYCFNHHLDEHTKQLEIWDSLGLNLHGNPINTDSFSPPYKESRQLTTSYIVPIGDDHACTIQDNKTPKFLGIPVYIPVWTYMLTENISNVLANNSNSENFTLLLTPNPSNDFVTLNLNEEEYSIKIFDQAGSCVLQKQSATGITQINITTLISGFYFIQASSDKVIFSSKFIKK